MRTLLIVVMVLGVPWLTQAQVDDAFDLDLDTELSEDVQMAAPAETKQSSPAVKSQVKQNRSIYIVNQASSGAKSAAKTEQNETDIIGSRAHELKRSRQRAEVETELKASEQIEESRLKDERRRQDKLFGNKHYELDEDVIIHSHNPPPVVVQEVKEDVRVVVKEREAVRNGTPPTSAYVITMLGMNQFPRAMNFQGNGIFGIGLGMQTPANFLVEGMFSFSSYQGFVPMQPWPVQLNEYTGTGAIKYQIGNGTIIPLVGGLVSYSYRTILEQLGYQDRNLTFNALDAGLLGGAEFTITRDFSIGAEVRYLWNISSQTNGYYPIFAPNQAPLDSYNHYIIALTGRYNF